MRVGVVERLQTIPALTHRVQGAAQLAVLLKQGVRSQAGATAFVLPLGLLGGKADAVSGMFRQALQRLVGVVLIVSNPGDATGEKALLELDPLIEAAIDLLAGWAPDAAFGVLVLARGELVSIEAGTIIYQLDFAIDDQLRIARQ